MTVLVFDTETESLPIWDAPSADPRQPHIIQLAMIQYGDDGTELSTRSVLIRPEGWEIVPGTKASLVHGITQERALAEGISEHQAVALWLNAVARASVTVAHSHPFDARIMRIAMCRAGYQKDIVDFLGERPSFCTASKSRLIVNLPPTEKMLASGRNTPKQPSLAEAYRYFFKEEIEGAHEALVDARAAARIFWHLKGLGVT
jgi:DNA polymerase-3 subunit epsilon